MRLIKESMLWGLGGLLALGSLNYGCSKSSSERSSDKASTSDPDNTLQTGKIEVSVLATGLNSALGSSLALRENLLRLAAVEDEEYGYPGIGMNYGDCIVESLKLKLQKISIAPKATDTKSDGGVTLVDFGDEGKELEIAEGYNGKIEANSEVEIQDGTYQQTMVSVFDSFSVKAYAYLDADNDGVIDTTIWTTATEVKKSASKITPANLEGYGFYTYPWIITTTARGNTAETNKDHVINMQTNFRYAVVVKDGEVTTTNFDGTETTDDAIDISLLVDTFRIIKVWDGRYQAGNISNWQPGAGGAGNIPAPVFPFPQSAQDSRTLGSNNMHSYDFYPEGSPAFAFSNYLNLFSLVNAKGLKSQVYLIAKTNTITPYNNQLFTVVMDGDGNPLFARVGIGESNETLHIGPMAKLFEKQADGSYNFASSGASVTVDGVDDGGLYYNDDKEMAGFLFTGFRKLGLGQKAQMTMKNGNRCKGEYDYCVDAAGVTAYYQRVQ